jgi:hypothetical protein
VVLAYRMAVESKMVLAEGIEAMEFLDFTRGYGVSGVPHTAINSGVGNVVGAVGEDTLVEEMRKAIVEKGEG